MGLLVTLLTPLVVALLKHATLKDNSFWITLICFLNLLHSKKIFTSTPMVSIKLVQVAQSLKVPETQLLLAVVLTHKDILIKHYLVLELVVTTVVSVLLS